MPSLERPKLWTDSGLERLGKAFRQARNATGLSMDKLIELLKQLDCKLSKKTISNFENGVGMPQWNTLASLAATQLLCFPDTNQPLAAEDFSSVAAEWLDPWENELEQAATDDLEETPIARLIRCYREYHNLSEEDFADIVSQKSRMSADAVYQIMQSDRDIPSNKEGDGELMALGAVLRNPKNRSYKLKDLRAIRDGQAETGFD